MPKFELNGFVMYRFDAGNWGVFDSLDDYVMLASGLNADEALELVRQLASGEIILTKEDQERESRL